MVLTGLPTDITKAVLWKRVRKVHESIDLRYPVEGEDATSEWESSIIHIDISPRADTRIAHLVFSSHGEALKSLPKLHGHTYKGAILSCVLKKRLDKLVTTGGEGKTPSHAGRLIVRNLAWDVSLSLLDLLNQVDCSRPPSKTSELHSYLMVRSIPSTYPKPHLNSPLPTQTSPFNPEQEVSHSSGS